MIGDDFWRDLMEGDENHGRKRSPAGSWEELGREDHQAYEDELWVIHTERREPLKHVKHGTLAAYTNDKCRCPRCRFAMANWKRLRRNV